MTVIIGVDSKLLTLSIKNKGTNPLLGARPLDSWVKTGRRARKEGTKAPSELAVVQRGPLGHEAAWLPQELALLL